MDAQFDIVKFEESSRQNGHRYWLAHDFMAQLGYETWGAFSKIINKAMASCAALDIDILGNFDQIEMVYQGQAVKTFKLSRFACFLITMHADSKKEQVSQAKTVLAAIADKLIQSKIDENTVERLELRERLKDGEGIMSAAAKAAGLISSDDFGMFKNAGFRGMYNMSLADLKKFKGVDSNAVLYDFMGHTELAGNYFRVTQTAEKIKSNHAKGLHEVAAVAHEVGRDVRNMMIQNSGIKPEHLAIEENIKEVKKTLKGANRQMIKHDKKKK